MLNTCFLHCSAAHISFVSPSTEEAFHEIWLLLALSRVNMYRDVHMMVEKIGISKKTVELSHGKTNNLHRRKQRRR